MRAYIGKRVTVDGITFEAHFHGDKGHVRVYECGARGMRKVRDDETVRQVVQRLTVSPQEAEQIKAREVAAAEAALMGVAGAEPTA